MSGVVVLGESTGIEGFALAGAGLVVAETPAAALCAWRALPEDTGLVVLTPAAAAALRDELADRPRVLTAVMPG